MEPPDCGVAGLQKKRIHNILRRIPEIAMDPDARGHSRPLRDLYRKLVAYSWTDEQLSILERETLDEVRRWREDRDEEADT